ncbi:MAG: hypothetical protein AB1629_05455 [Candidatus Omnitrophota bacterium]
MNKKQLTAAWVILVLLLSGCAKFSLTKEGVKFTVPFDFPRDESKNSRENSEDTD